MKKGRTPCLACGPFVLALLLAGCGDSSVPSPEENAQLENAEEMLNSAPDALEDIDENLINQPAGNEVDPGR